MDSEAKRAVRHAGAQLVDLAADLQLFAQLGLEAFDAEATMPNGATHVATVWAESWPAACRRAAQLFDGARSIVLNGRCI